MLVWDEVGARYYETGVSKGIYFPIDGSTGVPWNGLVGVSIDPSGGEVEASYFDGKKYMNRILAEDFQATVQAISTPKEFEAAEGVKTVAFAMKTHFNKRDKFHMVWRTEIGSDAGQAVAYKLHIAYNCLVQPAARNYATISDTSAMDVRSFVITATPACGRDSYFTFDSRDGDLSALEARLYNGDLPKCWELRALGEAGGGGGSGSGDPDYGCLRLVEDYERFNPGIVLTEDVLTDAINHTEITVDGLINNGLDITELPAAGAFAANDSAASEVGTGDILADDDDATYITSADGDLGFTVGLPPLVGYVPGCTFELHIRMSISGGVNPDDPDNLDADAQVHISTDAAGDLTIGGFSDGADEGMGFELTAVDGTPVDYVVPLDMDAWVDTTLEDVVAALEAGAYLNVVGVTNNNTDTTPEVRVYEATVSMLDATDQDQYLRPIEQDSYGTTEFLINRDGTVMEQAHTTYVDFELKESTYDATSGGLTVDVISYVLAPDSNPLRVRIELDGTDPVVNFYGPDGSVVANYTPVPNVWYQAQLDLGWDAGRFKLFDRTDLSVPLIDFPFDPGSVDPDCHVVFNAGFYGEAFS